MENIYNNIEQLKKQCNKISKQKICIQNIMVEKEERCSIHNLKSNLFCVDEKKKICKLCLREHTNNKHVIMTVKEYIKETIFEKSNSIITLVNGQATKFDKNRTSLFSDAKNLLEQIDLIKNKIMEFQIKLYSLEIQLKNIVNNSPVILATQIKDKLNTISEQIKLSEDGKQYEKEILKFEENINLLLNYDVAFPALKKQLSNIAIIGELSPISKIEGLYQAYLDLENIVWALDPSYCVDQLALSNNNMTVENVTGSGRNIVGTHGFNSGKHIWKVKIEDGPDYWIAIGVVKGEILAQIKGNNSYSNSYSVGTTGERYNVTGETGSIKSGTIVKVELDCDLGILKISCPGTNVQASGLKGITLYPYLCLLCKNNKCTISFQLSFQNCVEKSDKFYNLLPSKCYIQFLQYLLNNLFKFKILLSLFTINIMSQQNTCLITIKSSSILYFKKYSFKLSLTLLKFLIQQDF